MTFSRKVVRDPDDPITELVLNATYCRWKFYTGARYQPQMIGNLVNYALVLSV